jgi:uncharacterized repeat protein (TIGR01451 family)
VISYTISCTNTGPVTATNAIINDIIPLSTTYQAGSMALDTGSGFVPLTDAQDGDPGHYTGRAISVRPGQISGQLGPGEQGRIRFAVQIGSSVPVGQEIANYATLTRDYARPQNSALLLTAVSDLTLEKRADRTVVAPGESIAYAIIVGSSGSLAPTEVYAQDAIPAHTDYVPGSAIVPPGFVLWYSTDYGATWTRTPPSDPSRVTHLRWYTPRINAAAKFSLGYQARVEAPLSVPDTDICNQASAWSAQAQRFGSNKVCIETLDLALSKAYSGPTVTPGQPITYTLGYTNSGSATAFGAIITDTVPAHTLFDPSASTPGWSCPASAPPGTSCSYAVGDLETGQSGTLTFVATVTNPLSAGVRAVTNEARLASQRGFSVTYTITTPVLANAELVVSKSNGITIFRPGDSLTYTITLHNTGNKGATGITLTDKLPDHTTFVAGSASDGGTYQPAAREIIWPLIPLLPGEGSLSRTFQVVVDDPLPAHVIQITNTVTVTDDGTNGDTPAGNVATDVDTFDFRPALRMIKHGPLAAEAGETVVYTLTVATVSYTPTSLRPRGIGDGSLIRDLTVTDSVASPVHYVRGDDGNDLLEIGEAWVYTASYTIRDADHGTLVNVGTATGRDINGDKVTATTTHATIIAGQPLYLPLVAKLH